MEMTGWGKPASKKYQQNSICFLDDGWKIVLGKEKIFHSKTRGCFIFSTLTRSISNEWIIIYKIDLLHYHTHLETNTRARLNFNGKYTPVNQCPCGYILCIFWYHHPYIDFEEFAVLERLMKSLVEINDS